jgi:LuxR family transcriptional regulator, maltose regulon positive regulatory protein
VTLLLPTKFYPPPAPAGFVARSQLLEILDEALRCRLTLVSAPAGAGKTVLVSAWAQAKRQRGEAAFGWLSLDEADNAPGRFWEYLAACLEEGGAGIDVAGFQPENGETGYGESVPVGLLQGWLNLKGELILILDDYHLIQNQEIHAALGKLLEHMPPRLHLVILTRSDPPLELARLRVHGQLTEIRMSQLRFSAEEAAIFVQKSAGVRLSENEAAALNGRTEGWIAGLQMAAISLRGRSDAKDFVAAFAGSHRFVFDYLLEQVLSRQTPEIREFLLKTSVLERFCAPLCAAVAETESAQRFLDILERDNLFLVPLDDERGWYRYHHLFADLLKIMLERSEAGLAARLRRRASAWYEAHDLIPEAFGYALAVGDLELAARLVSSNALALVEHAELAPILLRMEATPRAQRESQPWLGVAHVWALAYTGQMERAGEVLALTEKGSGSHASVRLGGHLAAARAYIEWVNGNQAGAISAAEQAEQSLPRSELAMRALNLTTLGNALIQRENHLVRAVDVLEQATSLARQAGKSHVLMLAATALAYTYASLSRYRQAHTVCQEMLRLAEAYQQQYGQTLPAAASAYAVLAIVLSEWGEIEKSVQAARKGLALGELWGQADTIMMCLLQLVNSLSLAGETEAAGQVLQRARGVGQKVSTWFMLNVAQIQIRVSLDAGDLRQAALQADEILDDMPMLLQARLRIHQNRLDEALALLAQAASDESTSPRQGMVRLLSLRALALFLKNDERGALLDLKQALGLAREENQAASFIRDGEPMEKLLRRALARAICPEFTRKLLDIYDARRKPQRIQPTEALIEPLSERELEVLALLDGPLSTPEMAERLIVSANTVRTHVKSIYGKLGAHGRSGAVKRAQELGLLA